MDFRYIRAFVDFGEVFDAYDTKGERIQSKITNDGEWYIFYHNAVRVAWFHKDRTTIHIVISSGRWNVLFAQTFGLTFAPNFADTKGVQNFVGTDGFRYYYPTYNDIYQPPISTYQRDTLVIEGTKHPLYCWFRVGIREVTQKLNSYIREHMHGDPRDFEPYREIVASGISRLYMGPDAEEHVRNIASPMALRLLRIALTQLDSWNKCRFLQDLEDMRETLFVGWDDLFYEVVKEVRPKEMDMIDYTLRCSFNGRSLTNLSEREIRQLHWRLQHMPPWFDDADESYKDTLLALVQDIRRRSLLHALPTETLYNVVSHLNDEVANNNRSLIQDAVGEKQTLTLLQHRDNVAKHVAIHEILRVFAALQGINPFVSANEKTAFRAWWIRSDQFTKAFVSRFATFMRLSNVPTANISEGDERYFTEERMAEYARIYEMMLVSMSKL